MKPSNLQQNTGQENKEDRSENYFSSLKNEDYSNSFPAIETWLRKNINQANIRKQKRSNFSMKNFILTHKMKLVYTVIVLAIVIGACSIPVTQNETIGHILSWTLPAGASTDQMNNLKWIDKSKLSISENNDNGKLENIYTLMLPGITDKEIQDYQRDLEKIKDITSIKVFPLSENVKRPIYSAALHSFFRINIDATKISDEELANEVQKQLKENGVENVSLIIKTDENGRRMIRMNLDKQIAPKNFELRINDGGNQEVLKQKVNNSSDPDRFKGKTDEQIREMVKKELDNPNVKDNNIEIVRDKDGNVKVNVEVESNK